MSVEGDDASGTRAGFVAIIGPPNAGKSTLVNQLVGTKVAIVAPKVQTTRTRVLGILCRGASQIVLVDTPGIFEPKRRLERAMVSAAWIGQADADATCAIVDATSRNPLGAMAPIIERLKESGQRAALILNKIDAVARPKLLDLAASFDAAGVFEPIFMVSALKGDGVDDVAEHVAGLVPPGPWLFPEDQVTDMPSDCWRRRSRGRRRFTTYIANCPMPWRWRPMSGSSSTMATCALAR